LLTRHVQEFTIHDYSSIQKNACSSHYLPQHNILCYHFNIRYYPSSFSLRHRCLWFNCRLFSRILFQIHYIHYHHHFIHYRQKSINRTFFPSCQPYQRLDFFLRQIYATQKFQHLFHLPVLIVCQSIHFYSPVSFGCTRVKCQIICYRLDIMSKHKLFSLLSRLDNLSKRKNTVVFPCHVWTSCPNIPFLSHFSSILMYIYST